MVRRSAPITSASYSIVWADPLPALPVVTSVMLSESSALSLRGVALPRGNPLQPEYISVLNRGHMICIASKLARVYHVALH